MNCRTQWRTSGFGPVGLDYPAVETVARILGVNMDSRVFQKIRALEDFELERFNSRDQDA